MPEEVIFSSKEQKSIQEIGEFLIQLGQKMKEQGSFNLSKGGEQISIKPSGQPKLELKYEIENQDKHEFEIEIEWRPGEKEEGKVELV